LSPLSIISLSFWVFSDPDSRTASIFNSLVIVMSLRWLIFNQLSPLSINSLSLWVSSDRNSINCLHFQLIGDRYESQVTQIHSMASIFNQWKNIMCLQWHRFNQLHSFSINWWSLWVSSDPDSINCIHFQSINDRYESPVT
jgi:hypothetical protein